MQKIFFYIFSIFRHGKASNHNHTRHQQKAWFPSVFRIHDILVWIRIRGYMPLTNGSGSCYFRHWPSRCQQKLIFVRKNFCFLLFEGTFTSFFKDKKLKGSYKTVRFFLIFLLDDGRIRIHTSESVLRIRIRIRIHRIHMVLCLLDPDPLVRGTDPDRDPSIIMQK